MPTISCRRHCRAMGSRFEVLLLGDDEDLLDAVAVAVIEEIIRLDGALSRFDPRSEIARINREAGGRPARVDPEVFELLERCERARRLTAGYFDVTASDKASSNVAGGGKTPALLLDAKSRTARFSIRRGQR
jgi:FAD:protein FMN transferase